MSSSIDTTVNWFKANIWIVVPIALVGFVIVVFVIWAIVKCVGGIARSHRVANRVRMLDLEMKSVKQHPLYTGKNPTFAEIHERHQQRIETSASRDSANEFHTINLDEPGITTTPYPSAAPAPSAPVAEETTTTTSNTAIWTGVKRRLSDTWDSVVTRFPGGGPGGSSS